MNFRDARKARRVDPPLELTPLIDVVFLLLLFFMVTTAFTKTNEDKNLPLELTQAGSGESMAEAERVIISVGQGAALAWDEEKIREEELDARLRALKERAPDTHILIRGDKNATYETITGIIDRARSRGFRHVNLVVSPRRD